ncbi:hypothetical protein SULI_13645 [Saccharolobus solfataricus]|nr:hypothetical protein [Saccharolobus solfataricus]AKA75146.1 hypothetical protein SULB_2679 [Saccharolobus solfataricus]AKA77838.1 hypothetical protein SULC_2676 [Saccharolobus solfataricus]AKA80534.1 hypothetical protein SULA_2678 [Saccharolobus solfataricus]AZF69583.1 hypothetical protein SULG_13645 [Saccharolobus solfataricus]AZF72203.1 hypothetical protein SULH_13645 [Saccharolobus solfataricus]
MNKIDKDEALELYRLTNFINSENLITSLEKRLDNYKLYLANLLYNNYSPNEDLRSALKLLDSLTLSRCQFLIGHKKFLFMEDDINDLLFCYNIKLAKSLIMGNKYDYKITRSDIIELSDIYEDFNFIQNNAIIAKIALGYKEDYLKKHINLTPLALGALALTGDEFHKDIFNSIIESIVEKYGEESLLYTTAMRESYMIYLLLHGKDISKIKINEAYRMDISSVLARKFLLNYKQRYLASLVLF